MAENPFVQICANSTPNSSLSIAVRPSSIDILAGQGKLSEARKTDKRRRDSFKDIQDITGCAGVLKKGAKRTD